MSPAYRLAFIVFLQAISHVEQLIGLIEDEDFVYSNCNGLKDGIYDIELLEDYPTLSVSCENNFMIIDYSKDNNWENYFSSWHLWHYGISGPLKTDSVNWSQWFLPNSLNEYKYEYLVSKDCNSCDNNNNNNNNDILSNTVFYMNSSVTGCFSTQKGGSACDMTFDSYECKSCVEVGNRYETVDWDSTIDNAIHGLCWIVQDSSDTSYVYENYLECMKIGGLKPSIGIDGRNCVCAHPITTINNHKIKSANSAKPPKNENNIIKKTSSNNIVYLYQNNFESGTYRIKESGTYIIMEDIIFDFNGKYDYDIYSPNSYGNWWPTKEQNINNEYPGAGDVSDSYWAGFFAGITIECDDVIIDLNDKILKMSLEYFYQQPVWSHIELASQPFLPGQGIGFFGPSPKFASNVIIKNGIFGLTSHHCIHGLLNENILIENIICKDFATHGIQLNGFNNVELNNIEIGPNAQKSYLTIDYGNMRAMLPRLHEMSEEYPDKTIKFGGKPNLIDASKEWTLGDLTEEVQEQLDMAFYHVVYGKKYDENNKQWQSAKLAFINIDSNTGKLSGIPFGGALHGILLNYAGSSIPGYYKFNDKSNNVKLNNIYIHDLIHSSKETIYIKQGRLAVHPLNVPMSFEHFVGNKQFNEFILDIKYDPDYIGNIITDSMIAMYDIGLNNNNNMGYLGMGYLETIKSWAKGESRLPDNNAIIEPMCAGDAMGHIMKGILGLRINGVKNVILENINIENIIETGIEGSMICDNYEISHVLQQLPYQTGYTGNRAQGIISVFSDINIDNINVNNIISYYGESFGISLWPGSNILFKNNNNINNIIAGYKTKYGTKDISNEYLPNISPEGCGIRLYPDYYIDSRKDIIDDLTDESATANINNEFVSTTNVDVSCVIGHTQCLQSNNENDVTNFGNYNFEFSKENNCNDYYKSLYNDKQNFDDNTILLSMTKFINIDNNFENISILMLVLIVFGILIFFCIHVCKSKKLLDEHELLNAGCISHSKYNSFE